MVGAEFLAAGGGGAGGLYFEVEVLAAEGHLHVGLVGTNLGPQCEWVGGDACSWCYFMGDGEGGHGCDGGGGGVVKGGETAGQM